MLNHSSAIADKYPRINCTNCNTPSPTSQQFGKHIDDGMSFDTNEFGHYGGFTDNFPYKEENYMAYLCHDCCVILFNALPGLAKFAGVRGGHGNITGGWCFSGGELSNVVNGSLVKPCCQYAWTCDRTDPDNTVTYLATPELTWELQVQPKEQINLN